MMTRTTCFLIAAMLFCTSPAWASVEFNLLTDVADSNAVPPPPLNASNADGDNEILLHNGGIHATLRLLVNGVGNSDSAFNLTGDGFGIDADGADDAPSLLDSNEGTESVSIYFSVGVFLEEIALSLFSNTETANITVGNFESVELNPLQSSDNTFAFTTNNFLAAGEELVVSHGSGDGFSFDAFSVALAGSATGSNVNPEPIALLTWLGLGAAGTLLAGRRREEFPSV